MPHGEAVVIATNCDTANAAFHIRLQTDSSITYRRQLRHGIGQALISGERRIVIDCSSLVELDLILLSVLVDCANACEQHGARFELAKLQHGLRSRIAALRLSDRVGLLE